MYIDYIDALNSELDWKYLLEDGPCTLLFDRTNFQSSASRTFTRPRSWSRFSARRARWFPSLHRVWSCSSRICSIRAWEFTVEAWLLRIFKKRRNRDQLFLLFHGCNSRDSDLRFAIRYCPKSLACSHFLLASQQCHLELGFLRLFGWSTLISAQAVFKQGDGRLSILKWSERFIWYADIYNDYHTLCMLVRMIAPIPLASINIRAPSSRKDWILWQLATRTRILSADKAVFYFNNSLHKAFK